MDTRAADCRAARSHTVDVTVPVRRPDAFDVMQRDWAQQVGSAIPIPPSRPTGDGDYRIRIRQAAVDRLLVHDIFSESIVGGSGGRFNHLNEKVVVHLVQGGGWSFARSDARGSETLRAPAGEFLVRWNDPSWEFGIEPATTSRVLVLPGAELRPLLRDRWASGPLTAPAMRVLTAQLAGVDAVLDELPEPALAASHHAVVELLKGVLLGRIDGDEPDFAAALVRAAERLVTERLAEPDLSPGMLAAELHVSVRSLHRAFSTEGGESLMARVRRQRVDRALKDVRSSGLTVAEAAARWGFADSSHLVRACKSLYGETPTGGRIRPAGGGAAADPG